ncbi:TPA: hypothetical protein ACP41M_001074 [Klebsiella aerogenes]
MSDSLSLNNVRVHLRDIPEFFSSKLKSFITRQPDFNDAIQERLNQSEKALEILNQKLGIMSRNASEMDSELASLKQAVKRLGGG